MWNVCNKTKLVSKMLGNSVVKYPRGVGLLFVLVVGATSAALPLRAAVSAYGLPQAPAHQDLDGSVVDRLLPFSVSDTDWQLPERVSIVDPAANPGEVHAAVYSPEDLIPSDEFSTVGRHRGFRKFFLLVFVCGAIIRFFTSPTFVTFIRDALDPKAW